MLYMIRYGEIGLKSNRVRKRFERALIENIRKICKAKVFRENGRIFVEQKEQAAHCLAKVFGVVSYSPIFKTGVNFENIGKKCVEILKNKKIKTFGLKVRRFGNHRFSSYDVAKKVGDSVRKMTNLKVNLSNPDVRVYIEVRNNSAYLFTEIFKGPGGLPIGVEGKVLIPLKNESSILAGYLMMKRGCEAHFCGDVKNKFSKYLEKLREFEPWMEVIETYRTEDIARKINASAVILGGSLEELENLKFKRLRIPQVYVNYEKTFEEIRNELRSIFDHSGGGGGGPNPFPPSSKPGGNGGESGLSGDKSESSNPSGGGGGSSLS